MLEANQRRIGANVRAAREERGLSQEHVAAEAGIHPTGLSRIETGSREAQVDTLIRLAFALGVDVGQFFAGVERPTGSRPRRGGPA